MTNRPPPWLPKRILPRGLRGRRGYSRLLEEVPLRVSVSGIRGKSSLTRMTADALFERGLSVYAKITGTDPISYKNGTIRPIPRDPRRRAVIEETVREVQRHWPVDAVVLENQAITPYTMRVFNDVFCRPHFLLVTNIRRDHQGDIARTLPRMATAFGRSLPPGATLISGERDPKLSDILRREAVRAGGKFHNAAPLTRDVPGFESIKILDALLRGATGQGLGAEEIAMRRAKLEAAFSWRQSALPGVRWFNGAEINDVDSTLAVLKHLLRREFLPVTLVAYFRSDRVDRTASFVPFLAELLEAGVAPRVHVAGDRSDIVARRLRDHGEVEAWPDDPASIGPLVARLRSECRGGAVMTVANAVPPWPRLLASTLAGERPVVTPPPLPSGHLFHVRSPARTFA